MVDVRRRLFLRGEFGRAERKPFAARVAVDARCLAQRGVECRVCGEACEAGALRFVPARGGVAQLRVDQDACTGCGDCIAPCPVGALALVEPNAARMLPVTSAR